jgi:hypothetical protein
LINLAYADQASLYQTNASQSRDFYENRVKPAKTNPLTLEQNRFAIIAD